MGSTVKGSDIRTKEDFRNFASSLRSSGEVGFIAAFGLGLASYSTESVPGDVRVVEGAKVLEVWFPQANVLDAGVVVPEPDKALDSATIIAYCVRHVLGSGTYPLTIVLIDEILSFFGPFEGESGHGNLDTLRSLRSWLLCDVMSVPQQPVVTFIGDLGKEPVDAYAAYLKLHLWSYRKVDANRMAFTPGIVMPLLANVAWTSMGPYLAEQLPALIAHCRFNGVHLHVYAVDKVPHMLDFLYSEGLRVADASRVRLGANLGPGVTVMQAGFVNFNAQADGPNMIEGRLSSRVRIGRGTDLGGGSSTMGTMSGGNNVLVSLGDNCLVGANGGVGIPLRNNCKVEAGLYIKPGRKVYLVVEERWVDPIELAGRDNLTFRWNTALGQVEVLPTIGTFQLNEALHGNTNPGKS